MPVAVVIDSTAYLPPELVQAHRLTVVPLTVVLNGAEGLEGVETQPADATLALSARRVTATTSRPAPEQFARTYRRLLDAGADGIVSVHISAALSGTVEAARLAAADLDGRVEVVDSRSAGMGLGFPAIAAATAAEAGADLAAVRDAALAAIARTTVWFYVDTLEFLRRGGRINAAEALRRHRAVRQADHAHAGRGDRAAGEGPHRQPGSGPSRGPGRRGGRRRRRGSRGAPPGRTATGRGVARRADRAVR